MSQPEHFEMLILGSGEGGKYLAWHMAKAGHRTAVVERKLIGGSCPNTNCLPSKNEIWSAKVADLVHHAARFGTVTGPTSTDMKQVQARKRGMVEVTQVAAKPAEGTVVKHRHSHGDLSGGNCAWGVGRLQ